MEQTPAERAKQAIEWLISNGYASSNRELAEKMMYNPSTISLIINGKVKVGYRFAHTLSEVSGGLISTEWLYGGKGEMITKTIQQRQPTLEEKMLRQTMHDIMFARLRLEGEIARACARFTTDTGIHITNIECKEIIVSRETHDYEIRVPLLIPSDDTFIRGEGPFRTPLSEQEELEREYGTEAVTTHEEKKPDLPSGMTQAEYDSWQMLNKVCLEDEAKRNSTK